MEDVKDFGFYGSEEDSEKIREIRGITDEVSEFEYAGMKYPCICLKDNLILPKHKWKGISNLVKQGTSSKNITVYMIREGELYEIGALAGIQIKAFIDIVGLNNMFAYHNKDTRLEKDKLYVFSSTL